MAHSIVIHADHNDEIPHDHPHGIKALTEEFVRTKLRPHGHDVEEAHVHGHDRVHHDLVSGESRDIAAAGAAVAAARGI